MKRTKRILSAVGWAVAACFAPGWALDQVHNQTVQNERDDVLDHFNRKDKPMKNRKCETCRYFEPQDNEPRSSGWCCFSPPRCFYVDETVESFFPTVDVWNWCGRWLPKKTEGQDIINAIRTADQTEPRMLGDL